MKFNTTRNWGHVVAVLSLATIFQAGDVWCETDGLLHVQGKTLFPLGIYELPKEGDELKLLADAGVNLVHCNNQTDLDRVQRAGMFGWISVDLAQGATDELHDKVSSVVGHPALAVWEGPDEVVWNFTGASRLYRELGIHKKAGAWKRRDPEAVAYAEEQAERIIPNMRAAADMIRQIDNLHRPIWINEARDSDREYVRQYLGFVDITGCDLYPVKETKRDIAAIGAAVRDWKDIGAGKPVWMVLQAFSWNELGEYYGAETTVYPSFAESRFMAYDAIANGATGLFYWGSAYGKSSAFRQSICALISELDRLQPFLISPDTLGLRATLKSGAPLSSAVRINVRQADGQRIILVVNEDAQASFDIVVGGLNGLDVKDLQCLYTPEAVPVSQGAVTLHLEPLSVKLYATDRKWESTMSTGREFTSSPNAGASATDAPKFCNIILHNQGNDSIVGLHRFVDAAKQRGLLERIHFTLIMNGDERADSAACKASAAMISAIPQSSSAILTLRPSTLMRPSANHWMARG